MTGSDDLVTQSGLDAKAVANLFLDWADRDSLAITNLKLQKLLFFCHADFIKERGFPLIKEEFEAWDHGPVLPTVYRSFRQNASGAITNRATSFDPLTATATEAKLAATNEMRDWLRFSFDFYKRTGAFTLSDLSHREGGPWDRARDLFARGLNPDRRIGVELIRSYHRQIHT